MAGGTTTGGIDLGAFEVNQDPDAFAAEMLAGSPIRWSDRNRAWLLLSYKAATEGFLDPRLSNDRTPAFRRAVQKRGDAFERTYELLSGWMVFRDPPVHTRLREPVRRAFTPRVMETLRASVVGITDELIDAIGDERAFDFKERFAAPLPALVIADLLGVPRSERDRFQEWSDKLANVVFAVDGSASDPATEAAIVAATEEFIDFFGGLIEHRKQHPGEDLISKVVAANDLDALSVLEVVGACTLLLFAGHETTTNLLTNGLRELFGHPDQIDRIRRGEVDTTLADELLRVVGPAKAMVRIATETHVRYDQEVRAGDAVFCVILTANRDPATFPDPSRFDLGRTPNPHLGFGWGSHLCLGGNLARLEGGIAMRRIFERFPDIRPDGDPPAWRGNPLGRSLRSLHVLV